MKSKTMGITASNGIHAWQPAEDANSQPSNIHSFTHKNFNENSKPTIFR